MKSNISKTPLVPKIGDILNVTIGAVSFKNMGIAELSNGFSIFVPKAKLEDKIKIKILKVNTAKSKFAIANIVEVIQKAESQKKPPVEVGELLDLTITNDGPRGAGLIKLPGDYNILVPNTKANDKVKVKITRVKTNYAFGKKEELNDSKNVTFTTPKPNLVLNNQIKVGNKLTLILPKKANYSTNHVIVKMNNTILFIKLALGAKISDKVKVKITKVESTFAVAKVVKVSPISNKNKKLKIKTSLKKMVKSGMHFGEKVIKCHANMKKWLWLRKKGKKLNRPLIKKGKHIINLLKTRRCLNKSLKQIAKYALSGRTFLFVGTKKPAASLIARAALLTKTAFFVNTRWLGGMLTNWKTILKSISKIKPILKEKQKIIKNILEKRQKIKKLLIKKVNKLRNQSRQLIQKGKFLITTVKKRKKQLIEKSQLLIKKKKQVINKAQFLIVKHQQLQTKNKQLLQKNAQFQQKANQLILRKKTLIEQLTNNKNKLKQLKLLLMIGKELNQFKQFSKQNQTQLWSVSYGKFVKFDSKDSNLTQQNKYKVPNPPKTIVTKIINTMRSKYDINNPILQSNPNSFASNRAKADENNKSKIIFLSNLLTKFSSFLPYLKTYIKTVELRIQNIKSILQNVQQAIQNVKGKISQVLNFNKTLVSEISLLKTKLLSEQKGIKRLTNKLQKLAAKQKLLKFLPKLRYLPTPTYKMFQTIPILMKKFVDPKMKYPIDLIYDEKLKFKSKKIAAARKQKWQRLEKYFGGVTKMSKITNKQISQNVAIIVGQTNEMNAVRECKKLGIKMFHIVDTNCNPRLADHFVPANDDSRNSIKFILGQILTHIKLAQKIRQKFSSKKSTKFLKKQNVAF